MNRLVCFVYLSYVCVMKNSGSVRERLIDTAAELFYEKGYNSTGINEIIEKAQVAKASMYAHFRTKEDLCIAYLKYKETDFLAGLKTFIGQLPDGKAKVLGIFDFLLEFYHSTGFRGCWCINTMSEIPRDNQEIRHEIIRQKIALKSYITKLLQEHISVVQVESVTNQLYLIYEGAVAESYLHQAEWPILEAKEIAEKLI